jgi:hypothetical protein
MDYSKALAQQARPVSVEPSETSYFSAPAAGLDPRLIRNGKIIPSIRASILRILFTHLKQQYVNPEAYVQVWLAGSAVSYQWSAARKPADLDCLVGINYLLFRQANPQLRALSDKQIAQTLNEGFSAELNNKNTNFMDAYELTFYVNVQSDIRSIKPYSAYNLTNDDWTVKPEVRGVPVNKMFERKVAQDTSMATEILSRYSEALSNIGSATTDVARRNAEASLKLAVEQGAALYEDIHHGRKYAFSPSGQGYSDVHNYRWQAGKAAGTIQALKALKEIEKQSKQIFEAATYGQELPTADTLVRRALSNKRN